MSTRPAPPPPPPAFDEPLPAGWRAYVHHDGRCYYHNPTTNQTTWTPPFFQHQQQPPPPPPPPPGPLLQNGPPGFSSQIQTPGYPPHTAAIAYPSHSTAPPYVQPPISPRFSPPNCPPGFPMLDGSPTFRPSSSHPISGPPPNAYHPYHPSPSANATFYNPGMSAPPSAFTPPNAMLPSPPSYTNPGGYPSQPPPQTPGGIYPSPSLSPQTSFGPRPASMGALMRPPSMTNSAKVAHISLELSATGLRNRDIVGRSDPMCKVYTTHKMIAPTSATINWVLYAQTEMIPNSTSPSWVQRIELPYYFEQYQPLKFEIIDIDNARTRKGDFLGQVKTNLAELVTKQNNQLKLTDRTFRPGNYGILNVTTRDVSLCTKVQVSFQFSGKNLDKKDFFGLSDPYFKIYMLNNNNRYAAIYKSQHIRKNLSPAWPPGKFMLETNGEPWNQVKLRCEVYDHDRYTSHDLIGQADFSLEELRNKPSFPLINRKKVNKSRYVNSGEFIVHRVDAVQMPTFTQFLLGRLRLEFIVAVDFTSSNRPVTDPQSLHYMGDPGSPSQYWQALHAIGSILEAYVSDGKFTALGFGAILPGQNTASFDFALSGQGDARVTGVQGLLDAYQVALQNVTLSGPTNFTPLIRNAMALCNAQPVAQNNQHFCVLLIITDGVISDMGATVDTIIEASYRTPIAIVIVGVGEQDFAAMRRLDGDNNRLTSNDGTKTAKHDIVQFTQFKPGQSVEELAENVLQEVPQRVVDYMVEAGISPGV